MVALGIALSRQHGLPAAFQQGFARTYVSQRQTALANVSSLAAQLTSCESTRGTQPCYAQADSLGMAAAGESQAIGREAGLFFFPACLRQPAAREGAALDRLRQAAQGIRDLQPAAVAATGQLQDELGSALEEARAALADALKCEGP